MNVEELQLLIKEDLDAGMKKNLRINLKNPFKGSVQKHKQTWRLKLSSNQGELFGEYYSNTFGIVTN
jgi:hypothetical protein